MRSRGRWEVLDAKQRAQYMKDAEAEILQRRELQQLAADQAAAAEAEARAADEEEAAQPEPEEKQENPPITLDQADDIADGDGGGDEPPKPPKKKTQEPDDEEEPDDEDTADPELAAKADAIMKALQSGDEVKADKVYASAKKKTIPQQPKPKQPKPTVEQIKAQAVEESKPGDQQTAYFGPPPGNTGETIDEMVSLIEQVSTTKNNTLPKYAQKMLDKFNDPVARKQFGEYLEFSDQEEERIEKNWKTLSKVRNIDDAKRLLTEGMGLVEGPKGLEFRPVKPGMREFMSMAKSNTQKGYRGLQFREVAQLAKPEVQERILNADRQQVNADTIINPDVSWEMATELYDSLSGKAKGVFNKLGGADAMREAFDPKIPVVYLKDSSGKATGLTNIDVMAKTDPETYKEQFATTGGRNRGIFIMQKLLATGGVDQLTGLPNFLTPESGTIDHLEGRSQEMADESIRKDSPVNMAIVSNSTNWAKADAADPETGAKDTIPGLVALGQSYSSGINPVAKKIIQQGGDDAMKKAWMTQRIGGIDIRTQQDAEQKDTEPDSLDTFVESPMGKAGGVINRLSDATSFGYDLRNMTMYYPRADHTGKYDQNSWSGNPRKGSNRGYYPVLDGWRKSVLSGALYGPEINNMVETHREDLTNEVIRKRGSEPRQRTESEIESELRKFKKNYVKYHFSMPMRAIASAWTTGMITREEYIQQLRKLSDKALGQMGPGGEVHKSRLIKERDESLNQYLSEIETHQGTDELSQVDEEWLMKNIGSNPVMNMGLSEFGREVLRKKYPAVLDAFDKGIADGSISSGNSLTVGKTKLVDPTQGKFFEDHNLTEPTGRDRIEKLKRSLRDPF